MKQNAGILFHGEPMGISTQSAYDEEGKRKYLTRNEGRKFLEQVSELPKERALFCLTLYYTGCRITEALKLRSENLDTEMQVIRIQSLKKRGRKTIRRIPVPAFLAAELSSHETPDLNGCLWRFSRTTGWRIVKHVMKGAGIAGIQATSKGLRHGFGVRGALEQIPVCLIQGWMGHADIATTAIYLAVQGEEERVLIGKTW